MSESMIIGVDHGYAAMKTSHFSFPSGLVAYEHEPYTLKDVLEYGGKFYVVGSGRQALQKNKTQTEDYYLLTLAAIAKELSFRHAEPATEIHLAAGLPLTSFGREKNAFRDYLLRDGKTVNFHMFSCICMAMTAPMNTEIIITNGIESMPNFMISATVPRGFPSFRSVFSF